MITRPTKSASTRRKAAAAPAKAAGRGLRGAKPPRRTQAERSETTRAKLIQAAIVLLRERGYGGLRTSEVSDLAGVSRGAQLHHFPTKHELILATLHYLNGEILIESRRRAADAAQSDDAIADVIADAKDFFFSDYFFVSLAITMGDARDEDLLRHTLPMSRENRFAVEQVWLEALVARGLPRKIAADLLGLTMSIVRGLAIRTIIDDDHKKFDALLDRWREMVGLLLEQQRVSVSRSGQRRIRESTASTTG